LVDALLVEGLVDLFEELEAHNAIICAFVGVEDGGAGGGGGGVEVVDAFRVEDFVDAVGS
jgi:hypothetical protein